MGALMRYREIIINTANLWRGAYVFDLFIRLFTSSPQVTWAKNLGEGAWVTQRTLKIRRCERFHIR
jgi:hypothetical protein